MTRILSLVLAGALALAAPAAAENGIAETPEEEPAPQAEPRGLVPLDAANHTLDEFLWVARPLVVFADTPADPRFQRQLELLAERPEPLIERDVVVIVDTDPAARSEIRLALRPRGFSWVLVDKDGTVILRKPLPWHVREITRAIDKTPLRQQEIEEERRRLLEAQDG
ncbi:protein of unknown function [Meinhardsimonia xiamenensis]|jgi:hypothetical protein|uniref:DUF4174 domain-containing protein n=1 Tax=Meinhardsimonia xiamenensis TaxID=990712 RepID=A0A1G9AVF6_9RHOB|nr:DUF4174 domain-containing protein [Meinhardsimonia xiamenensis]PRX35243.1 uncharacterized protein DUF4174 [Meinhardsimonia xiamenensis]SDK30884.1 protein of unknown function [Meinhardsimonia xiamenensis]